MASKERILTVHQEIRRWTEEREARPAVVKGTGGNGDPGILRLMFPGYSDSDEESLEEISWDEFFRKFDKSNLALIAQDKTASGKRSYFNKLVRRDALEELQQKRSHRRGTGSRTSVTARGGRRAKTGTGRGRGQRQTRAAGRGRFGATSSTTRRAASSGRSSRAQKSRTAASRTAASRRAQASSRLRSGRASGSGRWQRSQTAPSSSSSRKATGGAAKTRVRGKRGASSEQPRRKAA